MNDFWKSYNKSKWSAALLALALPAILYWRTLAPSIVFGDSAEFQTEAWRLGVTHPTGYPFYLLTGKLFALLTPGEVAFRLNLFSAFATLIALFFLYLLLDQLTQSALFAVAGVWLIGAGSALWSQAIIAEVYALHAALVSALLYALIRWNEKGERRWAIAAALVMGLGLAHHRTIILLTPVAALYALLSPHWRSLLRNYKVLFGALLAPLLFYLYTPLRWPVTYHRWPSVQELINHLLGRGFSHAIQPAALLDASRWQAIVDLGIQQYTWLGTILAVAGALTMVRRKPRELLLTGLGFLTFMLFGVIYQVPDVAVFLIPAWIITALWVVIGAQSFFTAISKTYGSWAGAAILLALAIFLITTQYAQLDRRHDWEARKIADEALAHPPQPGALIVCDFERLSALRYAFGVDRPDLNIETVMPDTEDAAFRLIDDALAAGRPIYLARFLPGVANHYRLNARGPLVELRQSPRTELPPGVTPEPADIPFFDDNNDEIIRLIGFETSEVEVLRGETAAVTLYWQAAFSEPPLPYQAYLVLFDEAGNPITISPLAHPVADLYPLNAWLPHEVVADRRYLQIDAGIPPGAYRIAVGWKLPFEEKSLHSSSGNISPLTSLTVSPNSDWRPHPTHRKKMRLCQHARLLGFDAQGRPLPGRRLHYTFFLQRTGPGDETTLHLQIMAEGKEIAKADATLPLSRWPDNAFFPFEMSLPLPEQIEQDSAKLILRCEQTETNIQTIHMQAPPQTPGVPTRTSFSDKMMLLSYEKNDTVTAGDVMRITLHWWAMSTMTDDYAIFVHLLDDQGRVAWQHDGPPAFGTRPTTTWIPGETIEDVHEITLPADAPTDNYQIEIGVYSPLSWQRLNVLDEDGLPASDHLLLSPINILPPKN